MIQQQGLSSRTPREQELELEVARLTAELNTARGEEPTAATSRFLAMAAATVEQVVDDARREADAVAEEISSQAEVRRDEATRLAAEAEAKAARLRSEATRSQGLVSEAEDAAETIRASAIEEAGQLVAVERERVAAEIDALTEVRTSLEQERGALESYHEELSRRVQELAESMVAFMTTEPPLAVGSALEELTPSELGAVSAARPAENEAVDADVEPDTETEADPETQDQPQDADEFAGVPVVEKAAVSPGDYDPFDLDSSGPEPDLVGPQPDTAPTQDADLFSPATPDETEESRRNGPLSGVNGARFVHQTAPTALAEALDSDGSSEDAAFRAFIEGDDSEDPSRDWLLRSERS